MKKQLLPASFWTIALFLPAVLAGCKGAVAPPEEAAPLAPVQAQPAKQIVLGQWTDLLGTTQPLPNRSARISATVEGRVLAVLGDGKSDAVVEGQHVKAGQIIVQLDDGVPRANRAKLQATVDDLEEQQKQAGFALDLATIDVNRLKELRKEGPSGGPLPLVSRVDFEKASVVQKDAQSKVKSMAAKLAVARADLKGLDEQLRFFTLRAPIAGRLSMVQAVPGQTLAPGTVVADVVDLDQIDVLCFAPPAAARRLALDQPAKLILEEAAAPDKQEPLQGKIAFIGVQAQPETGNVPIKVRFPNSKHRVHAHAVVRVHVMTQPEKERLAIPEAAIVADRDIPTVVAIQDVKTQKTSDGEQTTGKARLLQVRLGTRDRDHGVVEILGLEDPATKQQVAPTGLLFVTAGGNGLQNDDRVKIQAAVK